MMNGRSGSDGNTRIRMASRFPKAQSKVQCQRSTKKRPSEESPHDLVSIPPIHHTCPAIPATRVLLNALSGARYLFLFSVRSIERRVSFLLCIWFVALGATEGVRPRPLCRVGESIKKDTVIFAYFCFPLPDLAGHECICQCRGSADGTDVRTC